MKKTHYTVVSVDGLGHYPSTHMRACALFRFWMHMHMVLQPVQLTEMIAVVGWLTCHAEFSSSTSHIARIQLTWSNTGEKMTRAHGLCVSMRVSSFFVHFRVWYVCIAATLLATCKRPPGLVRSIFCLHQFAVIHFRPRLCRQLVSCADDVWKRRHVSMDFVFWVCCGTVKWDASKSRTKSKSLLTNHTYLCISNTTMVHTQRRQHEIYVSMPSFRVGSLRNYLASFFSEDLVFPRLHPRHPSKHTQTFSPGHFQRHGQLCVCLVGSGSSHASIRCA